MLPTSAAGLIARSVEHQAASLCGTGLWIDAAQACQPDQAHSNIKISHVEVPTPAMGIAPWVLWELTVITSDDQLC
jgi:hypothetical protein